MRVGSARIGLERYLGDRIAKDVTLIAEGLTLVGRQISIDDGRLDLLAIDSRDRWVVIDVKPGLLDPGALAQALCFGSSMYPVVRALLKARCFGAKPRGRHGVVSGQPLRASQHHAIQTGRPTATAQTAMASGPSSPAGSVTATVAAPSARPAVQAPRR